MRSIDVSKMEFVEGSHTIWVHDTKGGTALRIKCSGKIVVDKGCQNPAPHADLLVQGDIHICWPKKARAKRVVKA